MSDDDILFVKWCPECRAYQPREQFYARTDRADGLDTVCKQHRSEHNRRDKDAEKRLAFRRILSRRWKGAA